MPSLRRSLVAVLALAMVVGACDLGRAPVKEPPPPVGVGGVPRCEDVPTISAPPEAYRDRPIYVGNEQPTEELRSWAQTRPGFVDLWIDRDHLGWVTLAFSDDAETRQRELESEFPGVGVVAVEVEFDDGQLEAIQQRVHEVLAPEVAQGSAVMTTQGVVMIMIGAGTPERIAAVEAAFAGQPVCIDAVDPGLLPEPGPQAPGGIGWRLLVTEPTGFPYRTGIAWDDASLADLWATSGVEAAIPAIDWAREVVLWFGAVYGSSCPNLRLDDVVVDERASLVYAEIVLPDAPVACTADANPRAFLVALERTRLPAPPFTIQLDADGPPGGAPEERTIVEADLRPPGSVAPPGAVHGDVTPIDPEWVESGTFIEAGFPVQYRMSIHCGIEWLGELNGFTWRTEVPAGAVDHVPPQWEAVASQDQSLILTVLLSEGPEPTIEATANELTLVYRPSSGRAPGCD